MSYSIHCKKGGFLFLWISLVNPLEKVHVTRESHQCSSFTSIIVFFLTEHYKRCLHKIIYTHN